MGTNKEKIRKQILKKRSAITPLEQIFLSDKICEYVLQIDELSTCENVLLYADYNGEVQTDKIALELMRRGKKVYMPKVTGDTMEFYRVFTLDELRPGAYGIREPIDISNLRYEYVEGDIILMPGVAFDNNGNRVGYGKGYYDKYLADKIGLIKVGLCYSVQLVDEITCEENDIKVDYIICED